jgi:cytochrome c oxidase subunit 2
VNQKWWSILFGVVMTACAGLFVVAPAAGWWLPDGVSAHAWDIDKLFYIILWITAFFFVLTEAILVAFMYLYREKAPGEVRAPSPISFYFKPLTNIFNTATKIEMAWTIVPSVILVYIAVAQVSTWADVKYRSRLDANVWGEGTPPPVQVELSARQFEWRFRYPSPDTWKKWHGNRKLADNWVRNPEFDDIHVTNELHCFNERHVVVQLSTKDVIHSFNIPFMRVKQDALPGKIIPVWFKPIKSNVTGKDKDGNVLIGVDVKGGHHGESEGPAKRSRHTTPAATDAKVVRWEYGGGIDPETGKPYDRALAWEIACAELCGWGHYRMIGRVYVHETEADFLAWLESEAAKQNYVGSAAEKK